MTAAIDETSRILIVNDDGIQAEGLALLEEQARALTDDVWVVAPQLENSGGSHAISLASPLRARKLGDKRFAVHGTPADCVLLAVWELMADKRPSLVLSGINHGENLADDMMYSGTLGAAIEASLLGIPAAALSQLRVLGQPPDFSSAREHGPSVLRGLQRCRWEPGMIINVNYPRPEAATGRVAVTKLGRRAPGTFRPVAGLDGRNVPYYWVKVTYGSGDDEPGTDLEAVRAGDVSITALSVDLTSASFNENLRRAFDEPVTHG